MNAHNHLALLLAAPQPEESAMLRDQAVITQVLLARGYPPEQVFSLHGRLDRPLATTFLQAASRFVAGWSGGSVFVHVSGHGFFHGETADQAQAGLVFTQSDDVHDDGHLFWDDFFVELALPAGVRLILLPDP